MAARLIRRRNRTMGSCTAAASPTRMATSGRSCGWTRPLPSAVPKRSKKRWPRRAGTEEGAMPINPNAEIEITAFRWVPEGAQGLVKDLRARWALEEAGLDYRVRLIGGDRPADYLEDQPFNQVPCLRDEA